MAAVAKKDTGKDVKLYNYSWSGKDKSGKTQKGEIRERVAGALEKEHWHGDSCEMVGALCAGLIGWVQWEPKKNEAADLIERLLRRGGGSHAAAHGLAAGEER